MLGTNRIRLQTATEIVVHAHSNALSDLRVKTVQLPNILNTELIWSHNTHYPIYRKYANVRFAPVIFANEQQCY